MKLAATLVLVSASAAAAETLTIDFNDLTLGSQLSNQYVGSRGVNFTPNLFSGPNTNNTAEPWATNTGLTVSFYEHLSPTNPGYAVGTPMLLDGRFVRSIADYNSEDGDPSVLATFQTPVTSATITFIGIAFFEEGAYDTQLVALGPNNERLSEAHAIGGFATSQQNLTVNVPGGFSRLAIIPGNYNDIVGFDNLVYTAAPSVPSWKVDADGNYWTGANWTTNSAPSGQTATARFGNVITAPRAVTFNDNVPLNRVILDSAVSYTLKDPSSYASYIQFVGASPELNVALGSHVVQTRLTGSAGLRKTGTGAVSIRKLTLGGAFSVEGGSVALAGSSSAASKVASISIDSGAAVTLGETPLILTSMTAGDVLTLVQSGRISAGSPSTLSVGYAPGSALTFTTIGGESIAPSNLLLRSTLAGDANLDLDVDFDDLLVVAQNYGQSSRYWYQGDFNADAAVNFDDLLQLAQRYGTSALADLSTMGDSDFSRDFALALSLVPEPATLLFAPLVMIRRSRLPR